MPGGDAACRCAQRRVSPCSRSDSCARVRVAASSRSPRSRVSCCFDIPPSRSGGACRSPGSSRSCFWPRRASSTGSRWRPFSRIPTTTAPRRAAGSRSGVAASATCSTSRSSASVRAIFRWRKARCRRSPIASVSESACGGTRLTTVSFRLARSSGFPASCCTWP